MLLVDFHCQPPLMLVLEDEEDYLHQLVAAQRKITSVYLQIRLDIGFASLKKTP